MCPLPCGILYLFVRAEVMRTAINDALEISRRLFLKMIGGIMLMESVSSSQAGVFVRKLPVRTVENKRFKFDAGSGLVEWQEGKREEYKLVVDGLVKDPRTFSYPDIRSFPRSEQVSDLHCVEGWSVPDLKWGGFRFGAILDKIKPNPNATHVLFHSLGTTGSTPKGQTHYIESFPLSELLDPDREILLALTLDEKPLPEDNGAPLRLVAPYDLAYKSIKFVSRIEFVKDQRPGWWTLANPIYPMVARVPRGRLRTKKP
jgi:DMSO/TMAO reductase YedYZ molybdopterin-dependent catalytic subunit